MVLQVGDRWNEERRIQHLAVNACLFPLVGVDGKHVITIEGIGNVDRPHSLQERIAKLHGSQCGFCTPGIVMSLYAVVRNSYNQKTKKFHLSNKEIEMEGHLDGNLCRCTGYKPILEATRTFVTEDLKGQLAEEDEPTAADVERLSKEVVDFTKITSTSQSKVSCGRPGGCCRDRPSISDGSSCDSKSVTSSPPTEQSSTLDDENTPAIINVGGEPQVDPGLTGAGYAKPLKSKEHSAETETKASTTLTTATAPSKMGIPKIEFHNYVPETELIYPPAL